MNICMLLPSPFPPDIRVEKEARSLIAQGHRVHLICPRREGQELTGEFGGVSIHRLDEQASGKKTLYSLLHLPYIWNREIMQRWLRNILDMARKHDIQALHVHDLPLVKIAIRAGRVLHVPVVFDMHENWPEALKVYARNRSRIASWFRVFIHRIREKYCIANADRIIVVVDEQKDRLVRLAVPPEKITVVMNTEDVDHFQEEPADEAILSKYRSTFLITYVGAFGPHRGLETAVRAMAGVREAAPEARLVLIGRGKNSESLRALVDELRLDGCVEFTGWVDFRKVPSYIRASDICLVPHDASPHTHTTIPHKLFQYMLMRKPVIVTDARPLKRIVEETESGLVVPSGDHRRMAEAIRRLHGDREAMRRFGENGHLAVLARYNWDVEAKKLCALYRELA